MEFVWVWILRLGMLGEVRSMVKGSPVEVNMMSMQKRISRLIFLALSFVTWLENGACSASKRIGFDGT